jgi:hypothetical protein
LKGLASRAKFVRGHRGRLFMIRTDQKTILMIDDDGSYFTLLSGPDMMEMCRTEITFNSHIVGCRQLTRKK